MNKDPNRDDKGRWVPGNCGGPGNPVWKKIGEYKKALSEAVSREDIAEIFQVLTDKSKSGDIQAIQVLLGYCIGKPKVMENDITFEIGSFKTAGDLVTVTNTILSRVAGGEMKPEEALKMANIIEVARRTVETATLENRIGELEKLQNVSRFQ